MGLFSKVPLDDDFDRALHDGANNSVRKSIAKAQPFIREILLPGEQLDLVFYESYTGSQTVVVTDQRLLVIRNTFGGGRPKELMHACTPADLRGARFGGTDTGSFVVLLQFHRALATVKFSTHLAAMTLTQAVNDLQATAG
ncbi:hypothetical protein ACFO3J_17270 [Streptomyces polygonati]|uniref:YokE-like PH domain-containing protein n=1 Tax=Streptomyces polygonati TaxID=1617087 RepID=A0ABV8HQM3_9ACTN